MPHPIILQLDRSDGRYIPGEPITGRVLWDLERPPERVVVRLFWQTTGKGTQDTGVAGEEVWEYESVRGQREFQFPGVEGPYSFSGKLITVSWLIEAYTDPDRQHTEALITLSPTGEEVRP